MSGLTPIPFRKGRETKPRLSPPRVVGRHDTRFWTADEIAIVRAHYALGGAQACAAHLPARRLPAIYRKAAALGLRYEGPTGQRKRREVIQAPADIDERLRAEWPLLRGRGSVDALADRLGLPRWWVSKQARRLGLAMPHRKEPRWTAAETAMLARLPLHDLDRCARVMREHGFQRTPTSIGVMARRQSLSRRYRETLSATAASKILGCDSKTVTELCLAGTLVATRRGTQRLPQQGGDVWAIQPADLRQYVLRHLERVDFRRVDKFAVVALLVGADALAAAAGLHSDAREAS